MGGSSHKGEWQSGEQHSAQRSVPALSVCKELSPPVGVDNGLCDILELGRTSPEPELQWLQSVTPSTNQIGENCSDLVLPL